MPSVRTTNRRQRLTHNRPVPKRSNLPPEVRLEPRAPDVASLHVVQNDCDDGWPSGKKRADDSGSPENSRQQAECVQGVDDLRPGDERTRGIVCAHHIILLLRVAPSRVVGSAVLTTAFSARPLHQDCSRCRAESRTELAGPCVLVREAAGCAVRTQFNREKSNGSNWARHSTHRGGNGNTARRNRGGSGH